MTRTFHPSGQPPYDAAPADPALDTEAALEMVERLKDYFARLDAVNAKSDPAATDNPQPQGDAAPYYELDV